LGAKIGISFEIDWESGRETLKMIIFARILTKQTNLIEQPT